MAQTGYTPISTYYTTTASAVPTAGNLVNGELALNISTSDGKLFYKDSAGVVQVLATKGSATVGGSTTQVQYNNAGVLAGSANFVWDNTNVRLGIGTASPYTTLNVNGTIATNTGYYIGKSVATVDAFAALSTRAGVDSGGAIVVRDGYGTYNAGGMEFYTGSNPTGSEKMRIDSSGNVGIGTSSPTSYTNLKTLAIVGTNGGVVDINPSGGTTAGGLQLIARATDTTFVANGPSGGSGAYMAFSTGTSGAASERMRIAANGQITVTADGGTGIGPLIQSVTGATNGWRIGNYSAIVGGGSNDSLTCANSGGGGVFISGASGTAWSAVSDERVKENLTPITDAVNKVSSLRAVIGNYVWDVDKTARPFLIAQDVKAVLPEAVSEQNDEIGTLGIAYTDVIPLLVASIQELNIEIKALKQQLGK
jgi:hypothetical protein